VVDEAIVDDDIAEPTQSQVEIFERGDKELM
jgi:hypothetical protein